MEKDIGQIAKQLRDKGKTYKQIATTLNRQGFKNSRGNKFTQGGIWGLIPGNREKIAQRGAPKFRRKGIFEVQTSKYDLLKAIETCADLKPDAKKTLAKMVFEETMG